jgi:CRP-like cAMP-binding protein
MIMTTTERCAIAVGAGDRIFAAGDSGLAWQVRHGVVRLDSVTPEGQSAFAYMAISGDILGCEAIQSGSYAFGATALTQCELSPWPEGLGAVGGESLLKSLATAQRRAADIVALRGGQAIDRVTGLLRLLADRAGRVVLPARQDMADITNLRFETISRVIKGLERSGVLAAISIDGVRATRGYAVSFPGAAAP